MYVYIYIYMYVCVCVCLCVTQLGIGIRYGLDGLGIESRWGAKFSAHVTTDLEAYPAPCKMGTGLSPGVKAAGT